MAKKPPAPAAAAVPVVEPVAAPPPPEFPAPFSKPYWLAATDVRPLGLMRILLGLVTLWDVFRRCEEFRAWHTDEGVLPRAALVEGLARPWRLSVLDMVGTPGMVAGVFVVGTLAALFFTLGYRTRLANILTWIFVFSLQERNLGVTDSSDTLLRMLLFWMMFSPAGATYSLDRALAKDAPAWPPKLSGVGLRFLQLQVGILYTVTSLSKGGVTWLDGSAVFRAMQVHDFARPTSTFFVEHLGVLSRPFTWASLVLEVMVAPMLFHGMTHLPSRKLILVAGTLFHLGIESTLNVGMFSFMMPMTYTLFLWPGALDWLDARLPRPTRLVEWFKSTGQRLLPDPGQADENWVGTTTNVRVFAGLCLVAGTIIMDQVHDANAKIFPRPPVPLVSTMEALSLWQNWRMFAPNPIFDSGPWTASGTLEDGSTVDVLALGAPGFASPPPGRLWYTRWNKFRLHIHESNQQGYLPWFANYLCHQVNDGKVPGEPRLKTFQLVYQLLRSHAPWEPENPVKPTVMWTQTCTP